MKRVLTATCFAIACAVGLSAQQTTGTTGTTDQGGQGGRGGPRTVTGCLRAGDTPDTYMLTDIQMANRTGSPTGTTGGTPAGGTTAGGTTAGGTTAAGGSSATAGGERGQMPTSITLNPADSSVDLKPHVGHKVEVTGTVSGGGRSGGDTTGGTTGSTAGGGTTAGGTAAGGTAQTTTGGQRTGGTRMMKVTSVRMVSESCS